MNKLLVKNELLCRHLPLSSFASVPGSVFAIFVRRVEVMVALQPPSMERQWIPASLEVPSCRSEHCGKISRAGPEFSNDATEKSIKFNPSPPQKRSLPKRNKLLPKHQRPPKTCPQNEKLITLNSPKTFAPRRCQLLSVTDTKQFFIPIGPPNLIKRVRSAMRKREKRKNLPTQVK